MSSKNLKKYVIFTYLVFWGAIGVIGVVTVVLRLKEPPQFPQIIASWTPTIVFACMFSSLYPEKQLIPYIKQQFSKNVHILTIMITVIIALTVLIAGVLCTKLILNIPVSSLVTTSPNVLIFMIFDHIIRGPMGEELGWRSFLLSELQKKYSLITAASIVGVVWAFWHLPLWLVSGYNGIFLIQYCFCFILMVWSLSIIISILYNRSKNLIIPVAIHFMFNYFLGIQTADLLLKLFLCSILYFFVAVCMIIYIKINNKYYSYSD